MALLDYPLNDPENPVLCQDEVYLRYPRAEDFASWATLRQESRAHLQPFEPTWSEEEFTKGHFRKRLRVYARDIRAGTSRPFFIFREDDHAFLGACILSNIRYRAAMSGTIGYWIGERYTRNGYAYSAVQGVILHAFERLQLERLEAACLSENEASQNLLKKLGFRQEGYARKYLQIDGIRQDHVLLGLCRDEYT